MTKAFYVINHLAMFIHNQYSIQLLFDALHAAELLNDKRDKGVMSVSISRQIDPSNFTKANLMSSIFPRAQLNNQPIKHVVKSAPSAVFFQSDYWKVRMTKLPLERRSDERPPIQINNSSNVSIGSDTIIA